jgi:DNA-binding response OmpR family regulator
MDDALRGKVIVVVEDEPEIGQLVKLALEDEGGSAFWAGDGRSAIRLTEKVRPHLMLLDAMLPDVDGPTIGRAVHDRYGDGVPIVVYSAVDPEQIARVAADVDATSYLTKPFELDDLLATVRDGLAEEERRRARLGAS